MDIDKINKRIKKIPRINVKNHLDEHTIKSDPFEQFEIWFDEMLQSGLYDPSAMVLATVDEHGFPDARVVLLKELADNKFIFYTNYNSKKAKELKKNKIAALNFYWPNLVRQIRIRGTVEKVSRKNNEAYFNTRLRRAKLSACVSLQSGIIKNRQILVDQINRLSQKMADKKIICPKDWGGYALTPFEYEFFQGRKWRIHDRFRYTLNKNKTWKRVRLSP